MFGCNMGKGSLCDQNWKYVLALAWCFSLNYIFDVIEKIVSCQRPLFVFSVSFFFLRLLLKITLMLLN